MAFFTKSLQSLLWQTVGQLVQFTLFIPLFYGTLLSIQNIQRLLTEVIK
jgi:hypothetical protein